MLQFFKLTQCIISRQPMYLYILYILLLKLGKDCKSTWKETALQYLEYNNCTSVSQYKLKFCSTCKKDKCCGPGRTKTVSMDFKCKGKEEREVYQFMWIRNCDCNKARCGS